MTHGLIRPLLLTAALFCAFATTTVVRAQSEEPIDSIVALVEEDVILRSELDIAIRGIMDRIRAALATGTVALVLIVADHDGSAPLAKDGPGSAGISPEKVADYVHAVLQADRTIYTTQVVTRMQDKGSNVLVTRVTSEKAELLSNDYPDGAVQLVEIHEAILNGKERRHQLWAAFPGEKPAEKRNNCTTQSHRKMRRLRPLRRHLRDGRREGSARRERRPRPVPATRTP